MVEQADSIRDLHNASLTGGVLRSMVLQQRDRRAKAIRGHFKVVQGGLA